MTRAVEGDGEAKAFWLKACVAARVVRGVAGKEDSAVRTLSGCDLQYVAVLVALHRAAVVGDGDDAAPFEQPSREEESVRAHSGVHSLNWGDRLAQTGTMRRGIQSRVYKQALLLDPVMLRLQRMQVIPGNPTHSVEVVSIEPGASACRQTRRSLGLFVPWWSGQRD